MARILFVDDDNRFRTQAETALVSAGHEVVAFGSGLPAAVAAGARPFDLAIVDLEMPTVPGSEVVRALLGARPMDTRPPMVLLLSDEAREFVPRGLPHDGFLQKPIESADLAAKVRALLPSSLVPSTLAAPRFSSPASRRYRRMDVRLPVHITVGERIVPGTITNLGVGGFQVEWRECPFCPPSRRHQGRCQAERYASHAPDTEAVETRVETHAGPLDLRARWVYTTRDEAGLERAGFQFTGVTPESLDRIGEVFARDGA